MNGRAARIKFIKHTILLMFLKIEGNGIKLFIMLRYIFDTSIIAPADMVNLSLCWGLYRDEDY